jgi:hypothetical protein
MKKTYLSYEAPEVELVEMAVECGFAASEVDGTFKLGDGANYGEEETDW